MNKLKELVISQRKLLCSNISEVVAGIQDMIKIRLRCSASWCALGDSILELGKGEVPTLCEDLVGIRNKIYAMGNALKDQSNAEIRTAEDLNDIIERFVVLFRCDVEYNESFRAYKEAVSAYEKAVKRNEDEKKNGGYPLVMEKLEGAIVIALRKRELAVEALKTKSELLCAEKERYNAFKMNRITHAWKNYSAALKESTDKQMEIIQELYTLIRNVAETKPELASTITDSLNELQRNNCDCVPVENSEEDD